MEQDCLVLFSTREGLEEAAKETAQNAPEEFQHSTYLYFIARFLVAVYEARFDEIPIQVWNEYRNALDHFYRHLTQRQDGGHLKRMEGHVQRAVLDVAKIICHDSHTKFEILLGNENDQCLRLIDNGAFYTQLLHQKTQSERLFTYAKTTDSALGDSAATDVEVLRRYLDACFSSITLIEFFTTRRADIDRLTNEIGSLEARATTKAEKHGFWGHVKASLVAKALWYLAIFAGGSLVTIYWPKIKTLGTTISSLFAGTG